MGREAVAVALRVPLIADPVDAAQVRWEASASGGDVTAVVFQVRDEESVGRVTFEDLDAIRVARGEYLPFERDENYEDWQWVYVVENSRWLEERHRYEDDHYDTPLIESHDHYVFEFHDEFVEAIARGIWMDKPEAAHPFSLPTMHPLRELPEDTTTERSESFGVGWELRTNPTPVDQVVEASRLCSQRLFQYNLLLDGRNTEQATVWVRTRRGRTVSSFVTGPFGKTRIETPEIATTLTFRERWNRLVECVATRRREMETGGVGEHSSPP